MKIEADPRDQSLAVQAYRQIEELIVRLELAPGLPISENALSTRLGIGRTPIREALHRLEREGLVLISPRRGIFVTDIRVDAQLRLLEVRRSLERLMSTRAARMASANERQRFTEIAVEMHEAGNSDDDVAFLKLDREFNQLVARASHNEFATSAINLTGGLSRRFWFRYYRAMADLPRSCMLHAEIASEIAKGNVEGAGAASDRLIDYIELFTRSVFESVS